MSTAPAAGPDPSRSTQERTLIIEGLTQRCGPDPGQFTAALGGPGAVAALLVATEPVLRSCRLLEQSSPPQVAARLAGVTLRCIRHGSTAHRPQMYWSAVAEAPAHGLRTSGASSYLGSRHPNLAEALEHAHTAALTHAVKELLDDALGIQPGAGPRERPSIDLAGCIAVRPPLHVSVTDATSGSVTVELLADNPARNAAATISATAAEIDTLRADPTGVVLELLAAHSRAIEARVTAGVMAPHDHPRLDPLAHEVPARLVDYTVHGSQVVLWEAPAEPPRFDLGPLSGPCGDAAYNQARSLLELLGQDVAQRHASHASTHEFMVNDCRRVFHQDLHIAPPGLDTDIDLADAGHELGL